MDNVDIDGLNQRKVDANDNWNEHDWKKFYKEYSRLKSHGRGFNIDLIKMFIKAVVKRDGEPLTYNPDVYYAPGSYSVDPMLRDALVIRDNIYVRKYYFNNPKEPLENV